MNQLPKIKDRIPSATKYSYSASNYTGFRLLYGLRIYGLFGFISVIWSMVNQILELNFSDIWSFRLYGQLYQDKTVDHISETRCSSLNQLMISHFTCPVLRSILVTYTYYRVLGWATSELQFSSFLAWKALKCDRTMHHVHVQYRANALVRIWSSFYLSVPFVPLLNRSLAHLVQSKWFLRLTGPLATTAK